MNSFKISDNYSTAVDSQSLIAIDESTDNKTTHYSSFSLIDSNIKSAATDNEFNKLKIPSILKKNSVDRPSFKCGSNMDRRDAYGVPIEAGSKRHRIKFKPQLRKVSIVENWKDYNTEENQSCTCTLI